MKFNYATNFGRDRYEQPFTKLTAKQPGRHDKLTREEFSPVRYISRQTVRKLKSEHRTRGKKNWACYLHFPRFLLLLALVRCHVWGVSHFNLLIRFFILNSTPGSPGRRRRQESTLLATRRTTLETSVIYKLKMNSPGWSPGWRDGWFAWKLNSGKSFNIHVGTRKISAPLFLFSGRCCCCSDFRWMQQIPTRLIPDNRQVSQQFAKWIKLFTVRHIYCLLQSNENLIRFAFPPLGLAAEFEDDRYPGRPVMILSSTFPVVGTFNGSFRECN